MNNLMRKIKSGITDNYTYICVFLICSIVLIICSIINKCVPFGDRFPIAGNGFFQDYAQFVQAARNVKSGKGIGLLDYGVGLTLDNYGSRTFSFLFMIVRPWFYLSFLLVPEKIYIEVFSLYYYFLFLVTGVVFIYYLVHRKSGKRINKKNPRLIVLGLAYNLSAFSISYFIYANFRFMVFIPIIFLGVEYLVYENNPFLYIFSLFYFVISEAYYGFIMCVFILLYFFILNHDGVKILFRNIIRMALASVLSLGLSSAFLFPYYFKTQNSPYNASDSSIPSLFSWFDNILCPLSDFRPFREGIVTTPQEFRTGIYCGLPVFLLLFLSLFIKSAPKKDVIKKLLFLLIIFVSFDNSLLNFIFHGFHHQWQVPNRYASFFIFVLLIVFNDILEELNNLNKKIIAYTIIISSVIMAVTYLYAFKTGRISDIDLFSLIPTFLFILIYCFICGLYYRNTGFPFYKSILIIMGIELVSSSIISFNSVLGFYGSDDEFVYIESIKDLTADVEDISMPYVITERPGAIYNQNLSYIINTHSLSYYTSTSYNQIHDLYHLWGVLVSTNLTYYSYGSPLTDMMLHVKYHITDSSDFTTNSPYPSISYNENLVLHENPYYLPLGIVLNKSDKLDEWNLNSNVYANPFDKENAFANAFNLDKLYYDLDIKRIDSIEQAQDISTNYYFVEEDESGGATYIFLLGFETEGDIYMSVSSSIEFVGKAQKDNCDTFYFYAPQTLHSEIQKETKFGILNNDTYSKLYSILNENVMFDQKYGSRIIKGRVNVKNDGLLYMAMPYLPGFKAYIDGNETEIISYLDGIALEVGSGEHQIELKYTPEGMVIGIIISSIFAIVLCVYILYQFKTKKEENGKEDM